MIGYIWRFIKRFAVLIPGLIITYLSVAGIYPWLDKTMVTPLAILITYILAAYIFIPFLIRLIRIVFPTRHPPLYSVTPDGFASDPINLAIIGTEKQLHHAMKRAGWHKADKKSVLTVIRMIAYSFLKRSYPSAPMSNLYLFGRKQDVGFEMPIKRGSNHRHHVRFWATTFDPSMKLTVNSIDWQHRPSLDSTTEALIWIGAASRDVGLTVIRHNGQVTHLVDSDTNAEREFTIESLQKKELANDIRALKLKDPYGLRNRGWRASLHTDGMLHVISLQQRK